jgi:protease I
MKRALIITGKYVQDSEYIYPFYRLQEAGYEVDVAVKDKETVLGLHGCKVAPTRGLDALRTNDYEIVIIPGGAWCMEYLRQEKEAIDAIRDFYEKGKIIGSICQGVQMLISAKVVKGKNISGYYSIKDDIENAGATYIDAPAVVDVSIVTSPHYKHMGDWMREILKLAGGL